MRDRGTCTHRYLSASDNPNRKQWRTIDHLGMKQSKCATAIGKYLQTSRDNQSEFP